MSKPKNSLVALAGVSLVIALIAFITPTRTRGQGGGNPHPLNVNVVNDPTVKVTDLYPARRNWRLMHMDEWQAFSFSMQTSWHINETTSRSLAVTARRPGRRHHSKLAQKVL